MEEEVSWLVSKGGSALKDASTQLETLRGSLAKRGSSPAPVPR